MSQNVITISQETFDKLYKKQLELEIAEKQLKEYKTRKAERAESYKKYRRTSSSDKMVNAALRAASRKLKSQYYQDATTLKHLIQQKIDKDQEYQFYAIINQRINAILGMQKFVEYCGKNDLKKEAVAQHVVVHGVKAMNSVFKDGLESVYNLDDLQLMNAIIFAEEELRLEQYIPKGHPEKSDE